MLFVAGAPALCFPKYPTGTTRFGGTALPQSGDTALPQSKSVTLSRSASTDSLTRQFELQRSLVTGYLYRLADSLDDLLCSARDRRSLDDRGCSRGASADEAEDLETWGRRRFDVLRSPVPERGGAPERRYCPVTRETLRRKVELLRHARLPMPVDSLEQPGLGAATR